MAKKKETQANSEVLASLQKFGWFRNISDKYQVGIPDNLGCYRGLLFGIEFKAVDEVPANGLTPAKKDHRFSGTQAKELRSLEINGGGIGIGMIACGSTLFWFSYDLINEEGQVDCNKLHKKKQFLIKDKEKGWDVVGDLLDFLWAQRLGRI